MRRLVVALVAATVVLAAGCQQRVDVKRGHDGGDGGLEDYIASIEKEDMELYTKVMVHDVGWSTTTPRGPDRGVGRLKASSRTRTRRSPRRRSLPGGLGEDLAIGELGVGNMLWDFRAVMGASSWLARQVYLGFREAGGALGHSTLPQVGRGRLELLPRDRRRRGWGSLT